MTITSCVRRRIAFSIRDTSEHAQLPRLPTMTRWSTRFRARDVLLAGSLLFNAVGAAWYLFVLPRGTASPGAAAVGPAAAAAPQKPADGLTSRSGGAREVAD